MSLLYLELFRLLQCCNELDEVIHVRRRLIFLDFLLLSISELLVVLVDLFPFDLLRLLAQVDQVVNLMVHVAQLIVPLNVLDNLGAVHAILLVSSSEWSNEILSARVRIDRVFLSFAKRHKSVVGAIQGLIPRRVPREFIVYVRIDTQVVLLDDFHTTTILKLLLEGFVHLCRALSGSGIPALSLHLS